MQKIHPLITKSQPLAELCARLGEQPFVAVDTEFMRENHYFPQLCLVQLGNEEEAAAFDPLAEGLDVTPFLELMTENHDCVKVFHAGGQDIEIICNMTGKTPFPVFDTQIAAMALGKGEQIGYANLVEAMLGIAIDKGARFTDWSRRPLDKRQIDYAIGDVTHLAVIFPMMLEELRDTGRGSWLDEEMARLSDASHYQPKLDDLWQKIRFSSRKPDALGRLRDLVYWRENEAREKNLPRGRVMKDESLANIALSPPKDQSKLARIRGLSKAWANNDIGARLMDIINQSKPLSKDEIPLRKRGVSLGKDGTLVCDLLKLLLKIRSKEIGVASRLIARSSDLELLAAGEGEDLPVLTGWRYEQFGKDAQDLVKGDIAFTVKNGKVHIIHYEKNMDENECCD